MPPLTVVPPVKVFTTLSTRAPGPFWTSDPLPVMAAVLKFVPCVTVPLRLKTSVPLSVIAAAVPVESDPLAPPSPICKVPDEIVVPPT